MNSAKDFLSLKSDKSDEYLTSYRYTGDFYYITQFFAVDEQALLTR